MKYEIPIPMMIFIMVLIAIDSFYLGSVYFPKQNTQHTLEFIINK